MLELPEAVTLASQMKEAYGGKVITRAVAGYTPHKFAFYEGDPVDYPRLLEGKTVGGSASFGGHALMVAGDMRLGFSDGVNARFFASGEERPKKHQLLLDFDDGSSLVCTISMYGFFGLCRADDQGNEYFQAAKGKPSPLSDAFDAVKSTLLDMTRGGGRDTEKDLYGQSGGYRTILSRNTLDRPCPVCGGALKREAYLGGSIYFCPSCQPLKK